MEEEAEAAAAAVRVRVPLRVVLMGMMLGGTLATVPATATGRIPPVPPRAGWRGGTRWWGCTSPTQPTHSLEAPGFSPGACKLRKAGSYKHLL
jgi:hypothetical protein